MIVVYPAAVVRTMDPSRPTADAIAVRDGRVVEVGSVASMQPWLRRHEHRIDEQFADAALLPGFIDPHVHPALMSILLATEWITGEPWELPGRSIPSVETKEGYLAALLARHEATAAGGEPLVTFGYLSQFHGEVVRSDLDAISTDRPIVVWQRSFHELRANTPGLAWLDAEEGAAWDPHIELATGRLYESGMAWGLRTLTPHLLGDGKLAHHLQDVAELVHRGGVTTIADAGYGNFGFDLELETYDRIIGTDDTPFRTFLVPSILAAKGHFKDDLWGELERLAGHRTDRIATLKAAKFFADGAFIAQLMQVGPPGYIDGHEGAWLSDPDQLLALVGPFWDRDYDIHIHTNGDAGVDSCLDALAAMLARRPRFDHRTTLHHYGVSTQAQARRLGALGAAVQANGYYLHQFGDAFVDEWLGYERASQMTRLGSVARAGASVAMHSDLPMGPVAPLLAASSMVTRTTRNGTVMSPTEALSVEQALAAITIEAAWQLRLDHEIGSLAAGKRADLVALSNDPVEVDPAQWADIAVRATVLDGEVFAR